MINLSYPLLLDNFTEHLDTRRSESAAFLIWYFENYLRLDTLDAVDSVCDQKGDKGIDGIYLNVEANLIEIYQSKISQSDNSSVGDKVLREFRGSISQFESEEAIDNLIATAGNADIAKLAKRLNLKKHISEFEVIGYLVSNVELDQNGQNFLNATPTIQFIGKQKLQNEYISSDRILPKVPRVTFDISGFEVAEYVVDADHSAIIAPIKASELVTLKGISDQSIFAYNVRGPLGKTTVNKDIGKTIANAENHKLFPLFHNGITIVASSLSVDKEAIEIDTYYVVNGCQSLSALYKNSQHLTDELRILTKFIKADPGSSLATMITKYSNNQNGIKSRDFKSNNQIQIRLQNELQQLYGKEYFLEIKRGEVTGDVEVISNEVAGQYLMAFDLKEPWGTHRKYQIFEDKHSSLFGRPSVSAHRIVLCHILASLINEKKSKIGNQLIAKYALTQFFILYALRLVLEKDQGGQKVIDNPGEYINVPANRAVFIDVIEIILDEIITDFDAEVEQLGKDFDYRGKLRDEKWCAKMAFEIASTHAKLVTRGRLESFSKLYERYSAEYTETH